MRLHISKLLIVALAAVLTASTCGKKLAPVLSVVDVENKKLIMLSGDRTEVVNFYDADFIVLGGGLGGIAAALSICSAGRTVILVEETDRIAGCFTYQDTTLFTDNRFVDSSGTSPAYQEFRSRIKAWYKENSQSPPELFPSLFGNLGTFESDNFCFETEAALDVINSMLAKNIDRGKLTVIKRHKIAKVVTFSSRVASLQAIDMDNLVVNQITGWMIVDATRSGYFLPLAGIDHFNGRESRAQTNEPHAIGNIDSLFSGSFMYCSTEPPSGEGAEIRECIIADLTSSPLDDTGNATRVPIGGRPRRLETFTQLTEQDISAEFNKGPRGKFYRDSVGIGYHPINIRNEETGEKQLVVDTVPFQIPLGALIPSICTNVLAGGRVLGASFVAAQACMAPSIEWAIGEAAGEVAAYCAGYSIYTHELYNTPGHLRGLQEWLITKRKAPIYWYDDVKPGDPDFAEAQLKPFTDRAYHDSSETLHYRQ